MIKRLPQEIADFFGCYVAQDKSGDWYLYEKAPVLDLSEAMWIDGGRSAKAPHEAFMAVTEDHDWKKLYSPKPADSDNKASHQSQVHVHQEYQVIADPGASNLFSRVNRLLADGWRPQGGIAVEHIDGENDSGYILYQAMVRGIE